MTKKTRKPSAMRKLIPAAGMLAVSGMMLASSTYAWFTMNKEVTVTGMEVKTTVGDSLLIAESTKGTAHAAENTFGKGINQIVQGMLQPASTISAANDSFFYTYDAKANGDKATANEQSPYSAVAYGEAANAGKISIDGGTTYTYDAYKDYVFEIKAINANAAGGASKQLRLTNLNLLYDGVVLTDHAYRIAIFAQDGGTTATYSAIADTTGANKIFGYTGAAYFEDGKAVASATTRGVVSPVLGSAWTKDIAAATTDYTKLTVRLWLEGEDTDCYSSKFLALTKEWTLDMKFELADTTTADTPTATTLINSGIKASISGTTASLETGTTVHTGATAVSYQWYKDNLGAIPDTAISGATAATLSGATAGDKVYCVITTERGTKYRTDTITVS